MMKKIILFIFTLLFLVFPKISLAQEVTYEAKITRVLESSGNYQKLEVVIEQGERKGEVVTVENGLYTDVAYLRYKINDRVVLTFNELEDGSELVVIADHVRRPVLGVLFVIFAVLAIAITGRWGALSILGMGYSFLIIFSFIIPTIIKGFDAVTTTIIGSIFIIPVTFSLSHGLNRKTVNAATGTVLSMVVVGILALIFVNLSKLTGFSAEEAGFLQYQLGSTLNMKGILLAGIIISSLGVMDDITISQAAVVEELKAANPKLSGKNLFLRSMRVGKDHIASMVNTLVLVYAGASLPLLLLFVNNSSHPFTEIVNYEIVAEEIVRTLVGSIGLVLAVPITTLIATRRVV